MAKDWGELLKVVYKPSRGKNKGLDTNIYIYGGQQQRSDKGGRVLIFMKDKVAIKSDTLFFKRPLGTFLSQEEVNVVRTRNEGGVNLPYGKKPEGLLSLVIELFSDPAELVMDFFLGSGTTAAVAHKMNRQYVGVEQLDYRENDSVVRLQNVISGDPTGISEVVNWHGGGDFISCDLLQYNEAFMDRIQSAKTSKELVKLWQEMAEGSFLNWYINPRAPEDAIKDFEAIGSEQDGVEKQKRLLAGLLDKNQLYVNLSEIDDARFKVSAEDKSLNKAFYGEAYNG